MPVFAKHMQFMGFSSDEMVIVSPDSGGANRARYFANRLNCAFAVGDKRRTGNDNNAEVLNVIGDVKDKIAVLYDDIIDTAGSLTKMATKLYSEGAKKIFACCAHGVLSQDAYKNVENSPIDTLFVTDSIPLRENRPQCDKIIQLSIAEMLAMAIQKVHLEESVSTLFK